MNRLKSYFLFGLVALFAGVQAQADQVKQARDNDVASEYTLKANGDLFRTVRGTQCQVTNNVDSLKISQHKDDAAMIYFEREDDLYVLHNSDRAYPCPKASKKVILANVQEYSVVSNEHTTIVNAALSKSGKFVAWDNTKPVLTQSSVVDYSMHGKFNVKGAPFNRYVLFAINSTGYVLKVDGDHPQSSKWDSSRKYYNLKEFKNKNNID